MRSLDISFLLIRLNRNGLTSSNYTSVRVANLKCTLPHFVGCYIRKKRNFLFCRLLYYLFPISISLCMLLFFSLGLLSSFFALPSISVSILPWRCPLPSPSPSSSLQMNRSNFPVKLSFMISFFPLISTTSVFFFSSLLSLYRLIRSL